MKHGRVFDRTKDVTGPLVSADPDFRINSRCATAARNFNGMMQPVILLSITLLCILPFIVLRSFEFPGPSPTLHNRTSTCMLREQTDTSYRRRFSLCVGFSGSNMCLRSSRLENTMKIRASTSYYYRASAVVNTDSRHLNHKALAIGGSSLLFVVFGGFC